MDNYGTVDNPAWITTVFCALMKPLILLCWQRLGVPLDIARWLVDLDEAGYTIVRTPHALEQWDLAGLDGIRHLSFNPERGTGQGDIHSPFTWLAVFDVLLTMLEQTSSSEHQFLLRHPDGSLYVARDICFADDLQSFGSTREGLQRTAGLFPPTPWFSTSRSPRTNSGRSISAAWHHHPLTRPIS